MELNKFIKVAAACSIIGAITTALLIFLPSPEAKDFEAQVQLFNNKLYLSKLWVLFVHPQFNLIAALGIAAVLLKKYPEFIIPATLFISIWAYTEANQQAFMIDAVNQYWRPGYINAENEATKAAFYAQLIGAPAIRDSQYFLLLFGFGVGSFLFGLALIKEDKLGVILGVCYLFVSLVSLISFARYYLGFEAVAPLIDGFYNWLYPWLQPLVRMALGIWLWKKS